MKHFLRVIYQYERTNNISERILATTISTVGNIGKMGSDALGTILKTGNGRIFQLAAAFSIWWIKEVSNGIHEGVEGCVEISDQGNCLERSQESR